MKKIAALILTVMMLALAVNALAEAPLRLMYDSAAALLFETTNVTLTGHAEFSLDGKHFKTADGTYIQDGKNSLWQWKLLTPRRDGSEREGGYTVIANGEKVYVMETFYPGVYSTGTTAESYTILRDSVQLSLLQELLRILADQADTLLGKNAVASQTDDTGLTVRLQFGDDVPEIVNTALNMTVQFAARRYFDTDYDRISERSMFPMENYLTVTQGILASTYYMSLQKAELTMKQNSDGAFESIRGDAAIRLDTGSDGVRMLNISFRLDASDWGSSRVKTFNPADYGVTLAEGAMSLDFPDTGSLDPETEKRLLEAAEARWALAGYSVDDTMKGSVRTEGSQPDHDEERIFIEYSSRDGSAHWYYFTDSLGNLLGLQNLTSSWQGSDDERHWEEYPNQQVIKETEEKLLSYLAEENPVLSADVLSLKNDWWVQNGEELYLHYWEGGKPVNHAWDEADFIVRVSPEWQIEFFSCVGNG